MKRLQMIVTDQLYETLKAIKKASGLSMSDVTRRALEAYAERFAKQQQKREKR